MPKPLKTQTVVFRAIAIVERRVMVVCLPEQAEEQARKRLERIDSLMGGPDCWRAVELTSRPEIYLPPPSEEQLRPGLIEGKAVDRVSIGSQRSAGNPPAAALPKTPDDPSSKEAA